MATMLLRSMCMHSACLVLLLVVSVTALKSQCAWDTHMSTSQVSGKNTGRVIDISVTISKDLPCWEKPDGLGAHRELVERQDRGGVAFVSKLSLVVHTGTHFDAPSHFLQEAFDSGRGIEAIQLSIMNGSVPCLPALNCLTELLDSLPCTSFATTVPCRSCCCGGHPS